MTASTEVVQQSSPGAQLATRSIDIQPIPVEQVVGRMKAVEQIVEQVMVEGVHWGDVPGVPGQKMIDKPGVEILAATFQLALDYDVNDSITPDGELRYIVKCRVLQQGTEAYLGSGMGEASTAETKYMWRKAFQDEYDAAGEDRRRKKTFQKNGQTMTLLQVRENNIDKANTAIKQACTRAARDAVLGVLGVRGMVLQQRAGREQQRGSGGQNRARQPQPPSEPKAGTQRVNAIIAAAADKGIAAASLLDLMRSDRGYQGTNLSVITVADAEFLEGFVADAPQLDPETGEVMRDSGGDS